MQRSGTLIAGCTALVFSLALTARTPHVASCTLVTEPAQGLAAIYGMISSARTSVDLTMYELSDTKVTALLAQAASRGVAVRVILDQNNEMDANTPAFTFLNANGVLVHWANPGYACTHQKTLTVDGATSAVMTLNLTPRYYATGREFAVITNDPADVAAIEATFAADFTDAQVTPPTGDDLVWSPTNARASLLGVIGSATQSLLIENEEMSDRGIVAALEDAAGKGVAVSIVMTDKPAYHTNFDRLTQAGASLSLYAASAPLYIHAKVILADSGAPGARVFIGSENFSRGSLDRNRELGLILSDPAVLASIQSTLSADFAGGTPYLRKAPHFN